MEAIASVSAAGFIWLIRGQATIAAPPTAAAPAAIWMKSRRVGTCSAASCPVITSLGAPSVSGMSDNSRLLRSGPRRLRARPHDWLRRRREAVASKWASLRMRLALFQPDIPQNVGAAVRLAACLGVAVDVIEPCGFPLSDRGLKRAALDYSAETRLHASWSAFLAAPERGEGRL